MRSEKSQEVSGFSSRNKDAALCCSQIPVLPLVTATYLGGLQCSIGWGWSHLAHGLLSHYALALLECNRETLFSTSPKGGILLLSPRQLPPNQTSSFAAKPMRLLHSMQMLMTSASPRLGTNRPLTSLPPHSQDAPLSLLNSHRPPVCLTDSLHQLLVTWAHKAGGKHCAAPEEQTQETTSFQGRNRDRVGEFWLEGTAPANSLGLLYCGVQQQQEHSSDLPTLLEAAASVSVPGTLEAAVCTLLACRKGQCPSCSPYLEAARHYREDDSEQVSPVACVQVCRMYPGEGHLQEEEKHSD